MQCEVRMVIHMRQHVMVFIASMYKGAVMLRLFIFRSTSDETDSPDSSYSASPED